METTDLPDYDDQEQEVMPEVASGVQKFVNNKIFINFFCVIFFSLFLLLL